MSNFCNRMKVLLNIYYLYKFIQNNLEINRINKI